MSFHRDPGDNLCRPQSVGHGLGRENYDSAIDSFIPDYCCKSILISVLRGIADNVYRVKHD